MERLAVDWDVLGAGVGVALPPPQAPAINARLDAAVAPARPIRRVIVPL
ncbi:MAG TPA: hypothetical protein VH279_14925 [Solirubrobacteraceae bacterium]|nr:hypothetical protein [Solirubrobacteraceae bacterium]